MANNGFSVEMKEESSQKPIGFSKRPINFDLTYSAPVLAPAKTPRFIGLSAALHMAALFSVLFVSPLFQPEKIETVTIELTGYSEATGEGSNASAMTEEASAAPVMNEAPATKDDVIVAKAPVAKTQAPEVAPTPQKAATPVPEVKAAPAPVVKATPPPAPKPVAAAKPIAKPVAQAAAQQPEAQAKPQATTPKVAAAPAISTVEESDVEVPANLEDAPPLDEPQFNEKAIAEFNEAELKNKLEKAKNKNAAALKAAEQDLESDSSSLDEQALADADAEAKQASQAAAARAEELKKKNAQAIAAAQAEEAAKAKADKEAKEAATAAALAAKENAEKQQAEQAAASALATRNAVAKRQAEQAAAAEAAAAAAAGGGNGEGEGEGTQAGPGNKGVPVGVRKLEQLRQMPGNPRPNYSANERLARHEGETVYLAYVTKDGLPTDFKKTKTTGYENLDSKTLAALKRWKFYPGQEGWVEIPFKWEIRGEAQEGSALNR